MTGYSMWRWFLGGLLQGMPLFLIAQSLFSENITPIISPNQVSPISVSVPAPCMPERLPPPASVSQSIEDNRIFEILNFWFGFLPRPNFFPIAKISIWFARTSLEDSQIRDQFLKDIVHAQRGNYNDWRRTPHGRLALILLLDQFPRHIYRNQPQEFMFDRMARALAWEGIQKGDDRHLYPIERAFFYLPFEHAEDLNLQNFSLNLYQRLVAESPASIRPQMEDFLQAARISWQQISRFGRFPYRNLILGRDSTPEEIVFLMQWGRHHMHHYQR